jgi:pyrroloquinoline quinone (PQQ) biosynthesis protein C
MSVQPDEFLRGLEDEVEQGWTRIFSTRMLRAITGEEKVTRDLLKLYLIESYHYVKHNPQHQALAVWQKDVRDRTFMREALKHALEEVDHDRLALRDLERLGVPASSVERSMPLPETLGFTGFLYYWVTRENPVGRLGYSLWAEGTQEKAPPVVAKIKEKFDISQDSWLTFFVAHAQIDVRHGDECKANIRRFAVTPYDQWAVRTVALTSMKLFINLLEAVYDRYEQVLKGAPLLLECEPWPKERGEFERI